MNMSTAQHKVSIIVPVYNPGKHFKKLLNSLVNQTLKEIEIIIVLDCPTDGSDKVAENFAAKDRRIVIIRNSQNMHAGLSRNEGLKVAKGEYVGFMDADDWCDEKKYEILYNEAKISNADIVRNRSLRVFNNNKYTYSENPPLQKNVKERNMFMLRGLVTRRQSNMFWSNIYRNDFIKRHKLSFIDSRKTRAEDFLFLLQCFFYAEIISEVHDSLDTYNILPTSLCHSHTADNLYLSMNSSIASLYNTINFLREAEVYDTIIRDFRNNELLIRMYSGFCNLRTCYPLKKAIVELHKIKKEHTELFLEFNKIKIKDLIKNRKRLQQFILLKSALLLPVPQGKRV
ncbi:MAG: glycosyltransferase [Bacteroidales bacterium]|jgi:glycosyltransferase involved in cell wall biosynthesis|nr:glycosyltransferase [Bacteroidales bacterium]